MKTILSLIACVVMLWACSTPKYTYNFDYYDYNSGKKAKEAEQARLAASQVEEVPAIDFPAEPVAESPLILKETPLSASANPEKASPTPIKVTDADMIAFAKKYRDMSKEEKRDFKRSLKKEVKNMVKAKKSGDNGAAVTATKAMDYNLKMAIIFAVVSIVLGAFGGVNSVFWILSVVSLVVAVVFFIKWIAEL